MFGSLVFNRARGKVKCTRLVIIDNSGQIVTKMKFKKLNVKLTSYNYCNGNALKFRLNI